MNSVGIGIPFAIPLMALAIPMVIVPVSLIMKYLTLKRQQQHQERMRAIELGYPSPPSDFWPAFTALTIGAGVPIGVCILALFTSLTYPPAIEPAWIVAGIIGGAGVLGGTILASILFAMRRRSMSEMPMNAHRKPAFDPEVFEPVGHR